MKKHALLAAGLLPAVTGCASIVRGGSQEITIDSTPGQATYEIRDLKGNSSLITGATPGRVTLRKGAGYFKGGSYAVTVRKPGYIPTTVQVESSLSGWYLGGNILVGGLIGYLAVDPVTGAMWKLQPENLQVGLVSQDGANTNPPATAAEPVIPFALPAPAPAPEPEVLPPETSAAQLPVVAASAPAPIAPPQQVDSQAALGEHQLSQPAVLLRQPRAGATVDASIPAGATVQLKQRVPNANGVWWFVAYNGSTGWMSDSALVR